MHVTMPALTPIEDTLFLTLCGRALDSRSPRRILGDRMADETIQELGYDASRSGVSGMLSDIGIRYPSPSWCAPGGWRAGPRRPGHRGRARTSASTRRCAAVPSSS
jgi:hypothetical protein